MKDFEIIGARYDEDNGRIEIIKEVTEDDGTVHMKLHLFSIDILEWRAAEYGIDDIDTLIDIVIHEPLVPNTDVYSVSVDVAREVHLQRINTAKVKERSTKLNKATARAKLTDLGVDQKYLDAVDNSYIDVIRNNSNFNKDNISLNKEYVTKARETFNNKKEVATQKEGKLTSAELRRKLLRESNTLLKSSNPHIPASITKPNHVQIVMRDGKIVEE